jgi:hypothetical protein
VTPAKKKPVADTLAIVCALCGRIMRASPGISKQEAPIYSICARCKGSRPSH